MNQSIGIPIQLHNRVCHLSIYIYSSNLPGISIGSKNPGMGTVTAKEESTPPLPANLDKTLYPFPNIKCWQPIRSYRRYSQLQGFVRVCNLASGESVLLRLLNAFHSSKLSRCGSYQISITPETVEMGNCTSLEVAMLYSNDLVVEATSI